ncbi:MAG: putative metalloprotease CJM1_0395 family protein [Pseudomonadota bacterium]
MSIGPLTAKPNPPPPAGEGAARPARAPSASAPAAGDARAQAQIDQLKARDASVRQREQARLAAAGELGAASYTYERGPNGVNYAVAGQVRLNTAPGRTPQETLARARTIEAAATTPADSSGADSVAATQALQLAQQARAELAIERAARAREQAADDAARAAQAAALAEASAAVPAAAAAPAAPAPAPAADGPAAAATPGAVPAAPAAPAQAVKQHYGTSVAVSPTISIYA